MKKALFFFVQTGLYTFGCVYASSSITHAQVKSDGTVNTQVSQDGNNAVITGGETRGSNLFHSFQDFSVPTGNEAFFNNADAIENIFSRVTGGSPSNIDGAIGANGSASLFLINPAGIIFGENARLDIGGSFYSSTASSILFDGGEFSAVDLENPPLLTVNAPIGLGFRDNPGDIVNRANFGLTQQIFKQEINDEIIDVSKVTNITGLEVNQGQDLALIGGNILLEGGGITAPGGNVTLGGIAEAGQIDINSDGSFSFPDNIVKADLSMSDSALVTVASDGGGVIDVDVRNLTIAEDAQLLAGIAEEMGNPDAIAGDIIINASESVNIIGGGESEEPDIDLDAGIRNLVGLSPARQTNSDRTSTAVGNGGSVFINTNLLEITERGNVDVLLYGRGNAGNVNIEANEILLDEGAINSQISDGGIGNSGDININTGTLDATNLSFIVTSNKSVEEGNAGDINIVATDSVVLEDSDNFSAFITEISDDALGDAGDINIDSNSLIMSDNVQLLTLTRGRGNAGNVNLDITESLVISGGANILTETSEEAIGNAGNIEISTSSLEVAENSRLQTSTKGEGNAGGVIIDVQENFILNEGSKIIANVESNAIGNAGEIEITSGSLEVTGDSRILSTTQGQGDAGNLMINVEDLFVLAETSNIQTQVLADGGQGDAGNITIEAGSFELRDSGFVLADTKGLGISGNITVTVEDQLSLAENSIISNDLSPGGEGIAGDIDLSADVITLDARSIIGSSTFGQGNGGNINIASNSLFLENFSLIAVGTTENGIGNAGRININTDSIHVLNGGIISSFTANDFNAGEITINANNLELSNGGNIFSGTDNLGNAGNINLNISDGIIMNGNNPPNRPSEFDFLDRVLNDLEGRTGILADATNDSTGNGGNINIDTNFIIAFPNGNSDIVANASSGNGGNITINAKGVFGIEERPLNSSTNDINASSEFSLDGSVNINTPDINPVQGATELPTNVVEPEETTQQACQSNREVAAKNGLNITGKGGIPNEPGLPLDSLNVAVNGEANPTSNVPAPIETSKGKIQPARGIKVTETGEVILTAYRTNNSGDRIPETRNCD